MPGAQAGFDFGGAEQIYGAAEQFWARLQPPALSDLKADRFK